LSDRNTLLRIVLENPADDTARLVLADCLRESDDPNVLARGRFLWAGVVSSRRAPQADEPDPLTELAVCDLMTVTGQGHPARWRADLGIGPSPLTRDDWDWSIERDLVSITIKPRSGCFSRGMLSQLSVLLGEWYEMGEKALSLWPIERVNILDVPGLYIAIEKTGEAWELVGGFGPDEDDIRIEPDPNFWSIRHQFDDRRSLVAWAGRDSQALVDRLNAQQEDR
jgi:uncharacterized protein (TIGR02996 family)